MAITFPWPYSQGEWLAWGAAALTILFGLAAMVTPRLTLRMLGLQAGGLQPEASALCRAQLGGFHIGLGLAAILFAQPLIYLALGLAWALAAFGRVISLLAGGGNLAINWTSLGISVLLAALPLSYTFGLVP